jgi:dihydrofolate synthase/folylpolyglutamate synthase
MLAYQEAVRNLISLANVYNPTKTTSKKVLERRVKNVRSLLDLLYKPDEKFKIIHVTGTSGKGTVVNLLKNALTENGFNTGALISPHTTTYLERFQQNNGLIEANELIRAINEVEVAYEKYLSKNDPLSFFDLTFVVGMQIFANLKLDYAVVEVGCGGRHDATNAINNPEVSIITNVDKDHMDILGNTLELIAFEKAGIIKKDGLVIVGESRPKLKKIFCDEAIDKHAALFFVTQGKGQLNPYWNTPEMSHNLAIANLALQELGFDFSCDSSLNNFSNLPCRFETVSKKPLIILDGAHNPAKMQSTANQLRELNHPMIALFGCGTSKDQQAMIKKLSPRVSKIYTTRHSVTAHKAQNPFTLLKQIPQAKRGKAFLHSHDAIREVVELIPKDHGLIVTGSLYLSGEIREKWYSETNIVSQSTSFPKK